MIKRLLSLLLAVSMLTALLVSPAQAAGSEEEALGEVDIYNSGSSRTYLSIHGRIQDLNYTYYNYVSPTGTVREIPAYCVNPNTAGVPQAVGPGESVAYIASGITSDPKTMGIVASGYPTHGLRELNLQDKYEAFYATKIALWCYLIPSWNIADLRINPACGDTDAARRVLTAAQNIYTQGTAWTRTQAPRLTSTVDRATAYPVTVDGKAYRQQIITIQSDTWVCEETISVRFADPDDVPEGTRLVDMDNRDVTEIPTERLGNGYGGRLKILFPADDEGGGHVQLNFSANVYRYAVYYAICAEKDQYGNIQNYVVDTDPTTPIQLSTYCDGGNSGEENENTPDTGLKITKLEAGTETPLAGALFEVIDPEGATVGTFSTNDNGAIILPLTLCGSYTVIEREPPAWHLLSETPAQTVKVEYGKVAGLTFHNAPYGALRVEKVSDTGARLPGATVQIQHIQTGKTYTAETDFSGSAFFDNLQPGAYRVQERTAPRGWLLDDTVHTVNVPAGEVTVVTLVNRELPGLRIIKYDRVTGKSMAGVTFAVYRDGEFLGNFRTDELGEILLTDLEPGTYRAFETDTGDDEHVLSTAPQEIELRAGDGIRELVFFNDLKPGIRLVKVDSRDPSQVLPNVRFEVREVGGSYRREFLTDEHGEIDLSKLTPGAYQVRELEAPEGYLTDDTVRVVRVNANENVNFVFTNTKKPGLRLIKTSSDGNRLAGVQFRIAKVEDGTHYLDRITDDNGEITITDLEPGVYSVKETATASDHILDPKEYHVDLFPGQTSTLVLENQKRPNLTVYKHDADTGEPIPNTVFLVKAADGHSVDEMKTDSEGKATLSNLLPGVYEISEKSVPSPYLLDAPSQLVTLYPNQDHTVYFENHRKPVLTINKVDSVTGGPIKGAKFQIWYGSDSTSTGELNDLGVFFSDGDGQIVIDNLRAGWYRVTELEPAAGFTMKQPTTQEFYIKGGEQRTIVFENTPKNAIVVEKYDSVTGEALPGCTFQLRYLGGTSGTGGTVIGEKTTGGNGTAIWAGLEPGAYVVEETNPADGYNIIQSSKTVFLADGGEQSVITVRFENTPDGNLLIRKVCAVNPSITLANAEFKVTYGDGTLIGDSNGIFRTDENGEIRITGLKPGKSVVVTETKAPDGFIIDTQSQTIQIQAGRTVSLTFKNQPMGRLILQKRDSATNQPLPGAEFRITTAAGCEVGLDGVIGTSTLTQNGIFTTDAQGEICVTNLVPGAYVITEIKAPEGYVIDTPSTNVVVDQGGDTQTVVIKNTPIGGVQLIKTDADTGKRLADCVFEIRRMDDGLVGTYTTDKNGAFSVPLDAGSYYALEVKAPKGYKPDSTPRYFEVRDGRTTTLRVTNKKFSGILIHKVDSTTGEGIYGVTFLLYDSNKNPIGQYTSDDSGFVYIEDLTVSGLYYLRELENEGYIVDTQMKTVYVQPGKVVEVRWENTPVTGQIQIVKISADYNSINGWPVGTAIPNTIFEIYNEHTGRLMDTVRTDKNGVAASRPLPLGRYRVVESQAADFYSLDRTPIYVEIEFAGQIVKATMTNQSLYTNVSITKTGYVEVMPGQTIRYTLPDIANNSTVALTSFYWRDTLPTEAVRLERIVTGTYNVRGSYKIVYKTNLNSTYRTMYDNLSAQRSYTLEASALSLGLAANEYVTEFMVSFGVVPANFRQVETPQVYCAVVPWVTNGTRFVNQADVGGVYNGQWIMAADRWVTKVYAPTKSLPKTGY